MYAASEGRKKTDRQPMLLLSTGLHLVSWDSLAKVPGLCPTVLGAVLTD